MFAAGTAASSLFEPFSVVWLKRSRAKPVTRTRSPTFDGVGVAGEDEDAVRGRRVAVAGRILDVEAAVGGRALEVADDDALGGDGAGDRGGGAAALDRVDRRERVAAGRGVVVDDRALALPVGDAWRRSRW